MRAMFRSCWQNIRKHWIVAMIVALLTVFVLIILAGYWFNWTWTGFNPSIGPNVQQYQPGKTLWDWLQLLGVLAIPAAVGLGTVWFTAQQGKVSDAENKDNQREAALQAYIDKISELLLHERLSELLLDKPSDESPRDTQVVIIALARTTTVLRTLDQGRRGSLIRFLSQAGILTKCIEDELVGIDLCAANLAKVNLDKINLEKANLQEANLREASLRGTNLAGANLQGAILWEADLQGARLDGANLQGDRLVLADLQGAVLLGANLENANLMLANLSRANLSGTILTRAILEEANLKGVTGINVERLKKEAKSLKGATMPDGSIHP